MTQTERAIADHREKLLKLRTDRVIRKAMDFSKLEFWPLRTETHIVSVSTDRVVRHVGVIWSGS